MTGKISREFFESNIIKRLGFLRDEVVVPPENGVDVGIVRLGNGYLAVTTDPFYIDPVFGLKKAAWFGFHILLSDIYTSGIPAMYMSIDLNLPQSMSDDEFNEIWTVINDESKKYNVMVVTGHTARYAGVSYPMIGGVTLMGYGDRYITTKNAGDGDIIIMTKTCALEASCILSYTFPEYIEKHLGMDTLKKLNDLFYKMTCVNEEILSIDFGLDKITSMHDATEGGIINALYEIGKASGHGVIVNKNNINIDESVSRVTKLFNIDPLRSISEGTLLITVKRNFADELLLKLRSAGIDSYIIGELKGDEIKFDTGEMIKPGDDQIWDALSRDDLR
ncbi:AIR synthase family protein [Picrophilus oshimae]|uniref:AIR Synthase n=1 Tax=Picrophilus torridus (strain ATCC 700027 / DSM 9790 / JCM 10055 / NBRC 100828 / KAW 2/3) TaxID=1122961 RepID=Q6KZH8_PICTO|nr:AIR synthase family protein [Picrophilus oshimae]AAT43874.1 AIR Synthase [Picrophilus oshimae DSM 9789]SMD31057.1 hydrogenase expression/formation protein HypE [Picrophilus oshimae DSM 9789]